jgi:hypothetical protein
MTCSIAHDARTPWTHARFQLINPHTKAKNVPGCEGPTQLCLVLLIRITGERNWSPDFGGAQCMWLSGAGTCSVLSDHIDCLPFYWIFHATVVNTMLWLLTFLRIIEISQPNKTETKSWGTTSGHALLNPVVALHTVKVQAHNAITDITVIFMKSSCFIH